MVVANNVHRGSICAFTNVPIPSGQWSPYSSYSVAILRLFDEIHVLGVYFKRLWQLLTYGSFLLSVVPKSGLRSLIWGMGSIP